MYKEGGFRAGEKGQPNYYEILGISQHASEEEIKRAFYRLARQKHPDVGGDKGAFQVINEAWQVLKDPEKRAVYDSEFLNDSAKRDHRDSSETEGSRKESVYDFEEIKDFIDETMEKLKKERREKESNRQRGYSTKDSAKGHSGDAETIPDYEVIECRYCHGLGFSRSKECPVCKGAKKIKVSKDSVECGNCHGLGFQSSNPCPACRGTSRVEIPRFGNPEGRLEVVKCAYCHGLGFSRGGSCPVCRGAKWVEVSQDSERCGNCHGLGFSGGVPCSGCRGTGRVEIRSY